MESRLGFQYIENIGIRYRQGCLWLYSTIQQKTIIPTRVGIEKLISQLSPTCANNPHKRGVRNIKTCSTQVAPARLPISVGIETLVSVLVTSRPYTPHNRGGRNHFHGADYRRQRILPTRVGIENGSSLARCVTSKILPISVGIEMASTRSDIVPL